MDIGAITKGLCKYVRGILSDSELDSLNQKGHTASMHSVIMDLDAGFRAYFNEEHNRCMQGIMSDMAERDACAFAEKYRLDHPGERITVEITPRPYNVILSSGRTNTKHYQVHNHKHVVLYDTAKEFFPKVHTQSSLVSGHFIEMFVDIDEYCNDTFPVISI